MLCTLPIRPIINVILNNNCLHAFYVGTASRVVFDKGKKAEPSKQAFTFKKELAARVNLGKRRAKQEKKESICFSVRTVFSYEVRSVPQLTIL